MSLVRKEISFRVVAPLAFFLFSQQAFAADHTEKISLDRPTIVGFFPRVDEKKIESNDAIREGIAHLSYALEDLTKCLQGRGIDVRLTLADRLIFVDQGKTREFEIAGRVGCYLVTPGKRPCIVYATNGPSSLITIAPIAAAECSGMLE